MKKVFAVVSACLALLSACRDEVKAPAPGKPTVKIGVILPLSGNSANLGEGALKAAQLAFDEATRNSKYAYRLVVEDDQLKSSITAVVIKKMIALDKVDAVMTYFSGAGFVVYPLANQHKFIHAATTWEDGIAEGKYNFVQHVKREDIAAEVQGLVKLWPDAKNIAVLTEIRGGSEELAALTRKNLDRAGYKTSLNAVNRGEKDFRLLLQKLKSEKTDLFILILLPPELDIIVRQMHDAGITNDEITGVSSFDTSRNLELHEGIRFISIPDGTEEFLRKMGGESEFDASVVYDLMRLLIQAYEANYKEGEIPSGDEVADYISSLDSYDCASIRCTMTPEGYIKNPPVFKEIKNGKIIRLKERP